ncbi:MAG: signal peptide peptidase SppA [Bacteroidetes bacterium]|nr:signal peptide peptidase SppA [Bacteroidota bacterium]
MAQFFKFLFASCLGVMLASVVLMLLGFAFIGGLISSQAESTVSLKPNSVLKIKFDKPIPEQTNNLEMNPFDLENQKILGLNAIVETIENAAGDDNIKGIYLDLESIAGGGLSTTGVIRDALLAFKESGKFIVANSKYYSQGTYYLASAADKVFLNPAGSIDLHGFSATVPFYKTMLENIGVEMQVFYAGQYKSATEPFRRYSMSEQSKKQTREFLQPAFEDFLNEIGSSRNKTYEELWDMANELKIKTSEDALNYGLVDELGYYDHVVKEMKDKIGLEAEDDLFYIGLTDYALTVKPKTDFSIKNKIAVIYGEGAIITGKGEPGNIGDEKYTKFIRKARKDKKVKAIVFRVNSPGGSPIASENILREIELAKEAGKPVVVSMGDYAASGGYYVACEADHIFAEENTLTGSIGVFMMLPNAQKLMKEKIGMTFDTVKTTQYSNGLGIYYDLAPAEVAFLNATTQNYYKLFKQRVAEGRNLTPEAVEKIAQGRVWTGEAATKIGLVDGVGGIDEALAKAADLAGLDEYRTVEYPEVKEPIEMLMEELTGSMPGTVKAKILEAELGDYYSDYKEIKEMMNMKGVQARCPIKIEFQ